jgi:hypothetical protein
MTWTIFMYDRRLPLPVGHSRELSLSPDVETICAASIASVAWQVGDASVASVVQQGTPDRGIAWLTGLTPGPGTVKARIAFSEGGPRETEPMAFDVVRPPTRPDDTLVVQGVRDVPAIRQGTPREFFSFNVPAANVDITVDWISPLNDVGFALFRGVCSTVPCGGDIVGVVRNPHVKPRVISHALTAGDYTVRVDNLGPGAETVRYEVRIAR